MIFVTDSAGQCVHISRDWPRLTGQGVADALGRGWLDRVHPDDRRVVGDTYDAAVRAGAEYSVRYRLLKPDDTPRWVGVGGVPSFGTADGRLLGYLGSITEIAEGATDTISAYGKVGRFFPPTPHPDTTPSSDLDRIADHLIVAHTLIEGDGGKEALPDLRSALFKIGRALAARTLEQTRLLN